MDEPPTRMTCACTGAAYPRWSGYVNIHPTLRQHSFKITLLRRAQLPRVRGDARAVRPWLEDRLPPAGRGADPPGHLRRRWRAAVSVRTESGHAVGGAYRALRSHRARARRATAVHRGKSDNRRGGVDAAHRDGHGDAA